MNKNLRESLTNLFQDLADIVSANPENLALILNEKLKRIGDLCKVFSESELVENTEIIAGEDSLELYWLARAGICSVENHLLERFESEDSCQSMWAAVGLVYLDNKHGVKRLRELISHTNDKTFDLTLEEIHDELCANNLEILEEIKEEIESGKYGAL